MSGKLFLLLMTQAALLFAAPVPAPRDHAAAGRPLAPRRERIDALDGKMISVGCGQHGRYAHVMHSQMIPGGNFPTVTHEIWRLWPKKEKLNLPFAPLAQTPSGVVERYPALSPDGKRIACNDSNGKFCGFYEVTGHRVVDEGEMKRAVKDANIDYIGPPYFREFSPDGSAALLSIKVRGVGRALFEYSFRTKRITRTDISTAANYVPGSRAALAEFTEFPNGGIANAALGLDAGGIRHLPFGIGRIGAFVPPMATPGAIVFDATAEENGRFAAILTNHFTGHAHLVLTKREGNKKLGLDLSADLGPRYAAQPVPVGNGQHLVSVHHGLENPLKDNVNWQTLLVDTNRRPPGFRWFPVPLSMEGRYQTCGEGLMRVQHIEAGAVLLEYVPKTAFALQAR